MSESKINRETLELDVLFVGAGPANLSAAIKLKQLINEHNARNQTALEPEIGIIEKGKYVGAHSLSGAILDPVALKELMPDYIERGCPIQSDISSSSLKYLTPTSAIPIPFTPKSFTDKSGHIISLSLFTKWLSQQAEGLGITVFEGFCGAELLYEDKKIVGVQTEDKGLDKSGKPKPYFEPGMQIKAKVTVLGEGGRGSLTKKVVNKLFLDRDKNPQSYETGVKEIWEIPSGRIKKGTVIHTFGFPLPKDLYGGSWIYAISDTRISLGYVTALDAINPTNDPHFYLQKFKTHPSVSSLLNGGTLQGYGAKVISGGGYYAMPKLYTDGLIIAGESAGFLNMRRLKGIHLSMKSGMLAAETIMDALINNDFSEASLQSYENRFEASWAKTELYGSRNFRQAFSYGLFSGIFRVGLQLITNNLWPREALSTNADHMNMEHFHRLHRQKFNLSREGFEIDGKITFDKLSDLYYSGTWHEEDQPSHIYIREELITDICNTKCTVEYGNPCQHFCPASVFEMEVTDKLMGTKKLRLNPANCIHCKTCDIADPYQVVTWRVPEGGGGPQYTEG
jgi:electron-transferring-flavoprotein dehydrogenase